MRRAWWALGAFVILAARSAPAQDTSAVEGPRAENLRRMIEERFGERLTLELGLSDDQAAAVRGVLSSWAIKRRTLEREDRRLKQDLAAAMRPGVAANDETVNRLVDALMNARVAYVQTFKDELKDLTTVLTPVQRAQYVLLRDRLLQRVQEVRNQRQQNGFIGRRNRIP